MIGAIILTADNYHEVRVINIYKRNKNNSLFMPFFLLCEFSFSLSLFIKKNFYNFIFSFFYFKNKPKSNLVIPFFYHEVNTDLFYSEGLLGNLFYFIFANILIGILLLSINSYFSLSIKYLDKGGGFECGFTSFVQTRERFNVIFYRVSLLFLIFDLEIILAFPFTAVLQKNQNIGKNNLLAFLYILIVGFIYELKEGALNIVKKPYVTEININQN
jgi:NADH:ubiquinone oxidoreductase subunit 3 (subunit A)